MPSPLGSESYDAVPGLAQRMPATQTRVAAELKPRCGAIVCGGGSSGLVIARRLPENREVSALLEAGGDDAAADVLAPNPLGEQP